MDFSRGALYPYHEPTIFYAPIHVANKHDNLIQIGLSPRFTVNIFRRSSRCRAERARLRKRDSGGLVSFRSVYEADREKHGENVIGCNHVHVYARVHHIRRPSFALKSPGRKFVSQIAAYDSGIGKYSIPVPEQEYDDEKERNGRLVEAGQE